MNAIIFGAKGQDGYYLSRLLSELSIDVIPVVRNKSSDAISSTEIGVDISNYDHVADLIIKSKPTYIFHFAANSTTAHAAMFENHQTISTGTLNILEAVKSHSPYTKVFISGSGLQFVNDGVPIKETDNFEARDPYSVSRIQSVYAARYFRSLGLQVYVGYFFNHDSPRRSERHMAKKISEFAKRISKGSNDKLTIGDIDVVKEWTFAGDVVRGVWELINQDRVYEATIGSGAGYSIREWLDVCFQLVGKDWGSFVEMNNNFKPDYKKLISDSSTLFSLGWEPEVSFEQLAIMMLNDNS